MRQFVLQAPLCRCFAKPQSPHPLFVRTITHERVIRAVFDSKLIALRAIYLRWLVFLLLEYIFCIMFARRVAGALDFASSAKILEP